MSLYKVGMYGGKFMPFHKGHKYCLDIAASECSVVYLILFCNGAQEIEILKDNKENYLTVEERWKTLKVLSKQYTNVIPVLIDVAKCRTKENEEDWDAETPLVLEQVGELNAVYGSEPAYGEYFSRAYPNAVYRIVDPDRKIYPISGTACRKMTEEERFKWKI